MFFCPKYSGMLPSFTAVINLFLRATHFASAHEAPLRIMPLTTYVETARGILTNSNFGIVLGGYTQRALGPFHRKAIHCDDPVASKTRAKRQSTKGDLFLRPKRGDLALGND